MSASYCLVGFALHGLKMIEGFLHRQGIHLAAVVFPRFDGPLQVMASNLHRHRIANDLACPLVVLYPRGMRKRNPDGTVLNQELDVDRVGMAGGNGHNQRLIPAMQRPTRPTVDSV